MGTPTVKQLSSRHARRVAELHDKMKDVARDLKQTDSDVKG